MNKVKKILFFILIISIIILIISPKITAIYNNSFESDHDSNSGFQKQNKQQNRENRSLLILLISFLIIFIFVLITRYLSKVGKISNSEEKIIWNFLLLIFFLPSAITGVIIVLEPIFPVLEDVGLNFLDLHSITSFFLLWIIGYHIIWHSNYYSNIFKKNINK